MASISPSVLIWARETAGLDRALAAEKLGLETKRTRGRGEELLRALEEGETQPSSSLLTKMSQQYHRPLISFYAEAPPPRGDRGEDFRTLPIERREEDGPTVDALVRDVRARQSLVRAVLDEDVDQSPLDFVGTGSLKWSVPKCAAEIIERIGFDRDQFRAGKAGDAFAYLRAQVEKIGVFVLLMGNLGTHHTNVSPEIFRGFALADNFAPFIVINDQDAKAAWSFTLLHELVHIWLGQTGISGGSAEILVERYCNDVASEILLPDSEVAGTKLGGEKELVAFASEVSSRANVSRSLVVYRLYKVGTINQAMWKALSNQFRAEWLEDRAAEKQLAKERRSGKSGGPSYFVVKRHRLGGALVDFVRRSMDDGALTPTKAGQVLGVRPMNVRALLADKAA